MSHTTHQHHHVLCRVLVGKFLSHSTTPTPPPAESSSRRRRSTKKKLGDRAIQISKPQTVTQSHHQPYMVLDFAIILVDFLKQPLAPRLFSMFLAKSKSRTSRANMPHTTHDMLSSPPQLLVLLNSNSAVQFNFSRHLMSRSFPPHTHRRHSASTAVCV